MSDKGFNGTTATLGGAAIGSGIRGIRRTEGGGNADVSHAASPNKEYEGGIPDPEYQIDFLGSTTIKKNDKGALVVNWNDGAAAESIGNWIVTSVNFGGQMDGEIAGSLSLKPTPAGGGGT